MSDDLLGTYRRLEEAEAALCVLQGDHLRLQSALAAVTAEAESLRAALAEAHAAQRPTLPPRPGRRSQLDGGALPRRVFKLASQSNQGGGHSPSSSVDAAVIAQGGALEFHTLRVRVAATDVVGLRERPTATTASVVDAPQAQQQPPPPPARRPSAPERVVGSAAAAGAEKGALLDDALVVAAPRRASSLDLPRAAAAAAAADADAQTPPVDLRQWELVYRESGSGTPGHLRRLAFAACTQGASYIREALNAAAAAAASAASALATMPEPASEPALAPDGHPVEWDEGAFSDEDPPVDEAQQCDAAEQQVTDTHVDLLPGPLPSLPPGGLPAHSVLTEPDVRALAAGFPGRTRLARWDLAYSSRRDGVSLRSLFRRCAGRAPTLLVVQSAEGRVGGAFSCEPWRVAPRYYGTGESFVFSLLPGEGGHIRAFKWSGRNAYFQMGQQEAVAVGGGGAYALKLDGDLGRGTSGDCDTFASPGLMGQEDFEVLHVDVWAFDAL